MENEEQVLWALFREEHYNAYKGQQKNQGKIWYKPEPARERSNAGVIPLEKKTMERSNLWLTGFSTWSKSQQNKN